MHGVRLRVAYDGRAFAGWQRQQPALRTVQGEIERAIRRVTGAEVTLRATGRTDAGVHAEGQVAAFDTPCRIPPAGWARSLNGKLAHDISIREAAPCPVGYDPRFDATDKTYRYLFHVDETRDPLLTGRAWHLGPRRARPLRGPRLALGDWLDLDEMHRAAELFLGTRDFRAFRASGDTREVSTRHIFEARLIEGYGHRPDLLAFEIRGTAFMQHMVRILAGTLLDVGRERLRASDVRALLTPTGRREDAGETAPPGGLYLVRISLGRRSPDRSPAQSG